MASISTAPLPASAALDPATDVGVVSLSVSDLGRSEVFYTHAIGLAVLERGDGVLTLGIGATATPLVRLVEQPGAAPWPRGGRSYTGLYHFAILTPTRADLGHWLRNWLQLGLPLPGQGDHLVSEALYLEDPDGHGIEVYRDRPRGEWTWQDGQVRMATDPVDIRGLLEDAEASGTPWTGMPAGTRIGHVHLQVGDIPQAAAFYRDLLGFDIVARMPSALFVSAGGYHHHLGMNVWHSRGASPPPADAVRLRWYTLELPHGEALAALLARLRAAGITVDEANGAAALSDPWGNRILLHVGPVTDVAAADALAAPHG